MPLSSEVGCNARLVSLELRGTDAHACMRICIHKTSASHIISITTCDSQAIILSQEDLGKHVFLAHSSCSWAGHSSRSTQRSYRSRVSVPSFKVNAGGAAGARAHAYTHVHLSRDCNPEVATALWILRDTTPQQKHAC